MVLDGSDLRTTTRSAPGITWFGWYVAAAHRVNTAQTVVRTRLSRDVVRRPQYVIGAPNHWTHPRASPAQNGRATEVRSGSRPPGFDGGPSEMSIGAF